MRKLDHPIAMFVVTVLALIGIGVGVVAATSQPIYGPSWGRFSAVFPGPVSERQILHAVWAFGYARPSSNPGGTGWTGYAPVSLPSEEFSVTVSETYGSPIQVFAFKTGWFHSGVGEYQKHVNGLYVITLGPQCASGSCRAVEIVSNGRVAWTVAAISPQSMSAVESFLDSFQPIGS